MFRQLPVATPYITTTYRCPELSHQISVINNVCPRLLRDNYNYNTLPHLSHFKRKTFVFIIGMSVCDFLCS